MALDVDPKQASLDLFRIFDRESKKKGADMKKKSLIIRCILYPILFLAICCFLIPTYICYRYYQRKELEGERNIIRVALQFESPESVLNRSKEFERKVMREMKRGRRNCLIGVSSYLVTLALVHELNEDYDRALYWLGLCSNEDQFQFTRARIEYKRGNLSSAFKLYCDLPENFLDQGTVEDRVQWAKGVAMMTDGKLSRFTPFASYGDFLAFLDEERQKVENASDYDKVVSWYHSLDVTLPSDETQTWEETL